MAILAFASKGGGGKDKNRLSFASDFKPVRTTTGFTLTAGPAYKGSQLLNVQKNKSFVSFNAIVSYQKGNTTFILPHNYRMSKVPGRNNLNVVDVKIRLGK